MSILRSIATSLSCLLACATAAPAAPPVAPAFSAEIVGRSNAGTVLGPGAKLYVSAAKVRIETPQAADGYFLIDAAAALFVRPAQKVYMDARQSSPLTQIFIAVDPADPCQAWQAAAESAAVRGAAGAWHCERIPRSADEPPDLIGYRVVTLDHASSERWVDSHLAFPVRVQAADGSTLTLEHVRPGVQPTELFALPPGYQHFDPQALIERIKHSDVWAAPPK
jgi:hypothetical protein